MELFNKRLFRWLEHSLVAPGYGVVFLRRPCNGPTTFCPRRFGFGIEEREVKYELRGTSEIKKVNQVLVIYRIIMQNQ